MVAFYKRRYGLLTDFLVYYILICLMDGWTSVLQFVSQLVCTKTHCMIILKLLGWSQIIFSSSPRSISVIIRRRCSEASAFIIACAQPLTLKEVQLELWLLVA